MSKISIDLPSPPLPQLAPRKADAHKGDFGSALLIGGSRGMSGAISLSGLSSLRVGAGLVRLAVPDRCLETVASFSPCFMTIPLADDSQGRLIPACIDAIAPAMETADCVAIGPGLGRTPGLQQLLNQVVQRATSPLLIDADGLNNLAETEDWSKAMAAPFILTPHPGEWGRLSGVPAADRGGQCQAAVDFAKRTGGVIVLKGHRTLITDGKTAVWNATGTPAMATGGSGDVLTGIITGLVCQGLAPREAAHLGVHVHGLAAELAAAQLHAHVVLPTELIDFLPQALQQLIELEE